MGQEKGWVYRLRTIGALLGYGTLLLMVQMIYWLFSSLGNNVTPKEAVSRVKD